MAKVERATDRAIVRFNDSKKIRDAVFNAVVNWCFEHNLFSGESIQQTDWGIIESPNLTTHIVDDILKFEVDYGD